MAASWSARMKEQLVISGALGYLGLWIGLPVFQLATAGLIYEGRNPALVPYAVVGTATSTLVFTMLYNVGQTLDTERLRGTLIGLFLAPAPRIAWLTGFALAGAFETSLAAASTVGFGMLVFGVRFDVDWPALLVSLGLLLLGLWGLGFVFSAIGLWSRRSNDVSNLVSPVMLLLGSVYYPITALPLWLRLPARALPLSYGVQALVEASLHHRPLSTLTAKIIPLAGFAVLLPLAGIAAFRWVEHGARRRGDLDLY